MMTFLVFALLATPVVIFFILVMMRLSGNIAILASDIRMRMRRDAMFGIEYSITKYEKLAVRYNKLVKDYNSVIQAKDYYREQLLKATRTIKNLERILESKENDWFKEVYEPKQPVTKQVTWLEVMGFSPNQKLSKEMVVSRYKSLAQLYHPDKPGGSEEFMVRLNKAYEIGKTKFK